MTPSRSQKARVPNGQISSYYYDPTGHLIAIERDGIRYYVSTDQLGTPKAISDSNGEILKMLQYDSYGNIVNDTAPDFYLPIGFAGGLADDSAGLVRFGFRDYDPISGRWTAKDPVLFHSGQGNLYVYTGNNPVEFIDPSGLKAAPCQADRIRKPSLGQLLWSGMKQCPGAVWKGMKELPGDIFNKDVGNAALKTAGTVVAVNAIPVSMAASASGVTVAGMSMSFAEAGAAADAKLITTVTKYGPIPTSLYKATRDSLNSPSGYDGKPDGIIGLGFNVKDEIVKLINQ